MELFSQRKGIKPVKSIMQVDSMDDDLRNSLWNVLFKSYWKKIAEIENDISEEEDWSEYDSAMQVLIDKLWSDYFKEPIDIVDYKSWSPNYEKIKQYFFNCKWYEVYDMIEFIANNYPKYLSRNDEVNSKFVARCNSILKKELSAYRFVGGKITQITEEKEIVEIEAALKIPISPVQQHIKRALGLLSDKKEPDYRNSIKESISAIEAICKLIANNNKATLGQALDAIETGNKIKMHSALKKAYDSLYGYTSIAEGIRHALRDEPELDFEDAKFMLVSCSAFINYLRVKSSKAGITL